MANPSNSRSVSRNAAAFLLAALATYIPFAALCLSFAWDLKTNPPPPALGGFGVALCFVVFGPLGALVGGTVAACLARYRRLNLTWLTVGILAEVSLTILALLILVYARVLPIEL